MEEPDPYSLIHAHRYEEALALCDVRLRRKPEDLASLANRALALLCLGQVESALVAEEKIRDTELRPAILGAKNYSAPIGSLLWMLGRRGEAIEQFASGTRGIRNGSIKYADQAGGGREGLLLYFAGVSDGRPDVRGTAEVYLTWLAKKKRIAYWPGPVVLHALGQLSPSGTLEGSFGTVDIEAAIAIARTDLLRRRELTQALFHFGIARRAIGDEASCRAYLEACCSLENPVVEFEWYLAHHELGRRWS